MAEAKEEGASKALRVVYKKKSMFNLSTSNPKQLILVVVLFVAFIIGVAFLMSDLFSDPQKPKFRLDDLYLDSATNSTLVRLTSVNPSSKSKIYYRKMCAHVWVVEGFETEDVHLESYVQQPHESKTWIAPVATNNHNEKRPGGSFQIRNGVTTGLVIAKISLQWKSAGIISLINRSLRVTCPVSINLQDLTSTVPKPMTRCSTTFL